MTKRADETAFVENDAAVEPRRNKRLTLPLTEDGRIDWDRARQSSKEAFVEAVRNDPSTLDAMELQARPPSQDGVPQITEEHVKQFMELYALGERIIVPRIISMRTKGAIQIPPPLAARVFQFTDEQKNSLAPPGAQWANESLPLWVKEWIAKIGPGAQFFGGLAMITIAQTQIVMAEYGKMQMQKKPPNGEATVEDVPLESAGVA